MDIIVTRFDNLETRFNSFEAGQAKIIGRLDVLEADVKIKKDDVDYLKFYADEIYRDVTINADSLASLFC